MYPTLKLVRVYPSPSPEATHFRVAGNDVVAKNVIVVDDQGEVGFTPADSFGGAVKSVAGRTGDIVLTHADITDWWTQSYTLPVATPTRLGGVKIGSSIDVTVDGTISATPKEFVQNIPQTVWTINHNLGYKPNSIEVEVSGEIVLTRHDQIDNNTFTVSFAQSNSGKVRYR